MSDCVELQNRESKRINLPRGGRDFFQGEGWKVPHMPSLVKGFRKQVPHMARSLRQQQNFIDVYPLSSC